MLTDAQVELFNTQGFLVIENVLDEETVLRPLKAEYNARLDQLMHAWVAEGTFLHFTPTQKQRKKTLHMRLPPFYHRNLLGVCASSRHLRRQAKF